jgi:ketosteroid isomerase-like protein
MRSVAAQMVRALEQGNITLIDSFLAPDYVCVDVSGRKIDKRARLKQLKEAGLKLEGVQTDDQSVYLYGQTVVITGLLDVKGTMNGRDVSARYRYLDVWMRRDEKWLAVATTMTRVVEEPPGAATPK